MKAWTLLVALLAAIIVALVVAYIILARRLRDAEEALCARFDENGYFRYSGRIDGWPGAEVVIADGERTHRDCADKFNNTNNFRGWPAGQWGIGETGPELIIPHGEHRLNPPRTDTGD